MKTKRLGPVVAALLATAPIAASAGELEWLWLKGDVGYQGLTLRTFNLDAEEQTAELVPQSLGGPAWAFGVGVRLMNITLGLRGGAGHLSGAATDGRGDATLWSFDGEIGIRAPIGRAAPYLLMGSGYSALHDIDEEWDGLERGLDIDGFNVRAGLGVEVYLNKMLSVDLRAVTEAMFLARDGVSAGVLVAPRRVGELDAEETQRLLDADGASVGFGYQIGASVGFHL